MGYETDLKLFIDGVWKSGEGRDAHTVINPVTGGGIAEVPYATAADLEEAIAASGRAWPEWRSTDVEKRGAILHKTADPLVDAYMWIKRPGESDGTCRGGPEAGEWFQKYALELAGNAEN